MKNKKIVIAAATLALIGAASVGPAMAYFTDSHFAYTVKKVSIDDGKITPDENVDGSVKTVTVKNTGTTELWVRIRVFSPVGVEAVEGLGVNPDGEHEKVVGWIKEEDYYTYNEVLPAGQTTKPIVFNVSLPTGEAVTADSQNEINVVIVEEATRVTYGETGALETPKWDLKADESQVEVNVVVNPSTDNEGGHNNADQN